MTCVICKNGRTAPGYTTATLQRGETTTVIIKNVPAEICGNCGEHYLDDRVAEVVLERAEAAVRNGAEVEIVAYAA